MLALFSVIQPLKWSSRLPTGRIVDRATAPNLFALIDAVAKAVGTTPVKRVFVTGRYNAAYLKDRRRRPMMEIGVPMWVVLTPQERVALLGHELGHRVNGDLRDLAFVAYALDTLENWIRLFNPGGVRVIVMSGGDPARGLVNLAELLLPVVLFPVTLLLSLVGGFLELMAMRQGQRCEYYADEMGARAAGTTAAAGVEDKALIADACMRQLRHLIRFQPSQNPWQGLVAFVQSMPPTELERLRRQARKRLHRIDTTHPPTALRLDYVNSLPEDCGAVHANADQMRLVNAELSAAAERISARLRSAYA
jgi:Zn-dependent protease with chaperone function